MNNVSFQSYNSHSFDLKTFQAVFKLLEEKVEPLTKIGNDDPPKWPYENSRQAAKIADDIFTGIIEPDPILGIEIYGLCNRSYQIHFDQSPSRPDLIKATRCNFSIHRRSFYSGKYLSTETYRDLLNQFFSLTESIVAFSGMGWFHQKGVGIGWYTIFGKPYFDILGGKEHILRTPAFRAYDLGNAVAIQTTEHPWSNGGDWSHDNDDIKYAIAEHLDPQAVSIIRPCSPPIKNPVVPLRN